MSRRAPPPDSANSYNVATPPLPTGAAACLRVSATVPIGQPLEVRRARVVHYRNVHYKEAPVEAPRPAPPRRSAGKQASKDPTS